MVEHPSEHVPEQLGGDPSEQTALRISLEQALSQLTAKQHAVIVLRLYEDRTVEEAAHLLGCSIGTVKSQTHYALGRLRSLVPDLVGKVGGAAPTRDPISTNDGIPAKEVRA
jgi:RNA polymerase sigma factor (sigma-70 family)